MIEPRFTVDIDNPLDWVRAEWLVYHAGLDMVTPGRQRRLFPKRVNLVVFDFDGVMTDNRVWVGEDGYEQVAANRSDSLGLAALRKTGVEALVLSMETNPVVMARCRKLGLPVLQGIQDKSTVLQNYLAEHQFDPQNVVYVGNDTNDLPCFPVAGYAVAVSDAQPEVLRQADLILTQRGGYGAVREICDFIRQKRS